MHRIRIIFIISAMALISIVAKADNAPPVIGGDCGRTFLIATDRTIENKIHFTAEDPDPGDDITWSIVSVSPDIGNLMVFIEDGDVSITALGESGIFEVTVRSTDNNGLYDECSFFVEVVACCGNMSIQIENVYDAILGQHAYVDVKKMDGSEDWTAFDLLMIYDANALTFGGAQEGQMLQDYEWEYFAYQYGHPGDCQSNCPDGLIRVISIADVDDGVHEPLSTALIPGEALFTLDFHLTGSQNYMCEFVPINFYWEDCADNTVSFNVGWGDDYQALSYNVYQLGGEIFHYGQYYSDVTDETCGFPTPTGHQADCYAHDEDEMYIPLVFANLYGGGVNFVCIEKTNRGDINCNGTAYEMADVVFYVNLLTITGFPDPWPEGCWDALDVNGDGVILTVSDVVYLIRVITGTAEPYSKPKNIEPVEITCNEGSIIADTEIGGALFVFEGQVDAELGSGAAGMELIKHADDTETRIFLYSPEADNTAIGELLRTDGNLTKIDLSDPYGYRYPVSIKPIEFSLRQNYPNPFNPITTIELTLPVASDYALTVYNIAGQKIREITGYHEAGNVDLIIDLSDHSSGIYFYKIVAGDFCDTRKMTLIK